MTDCHSNAINGMLEGLQAQVGKDRIFNVFVN